MSTGPGLLRLLSVAAVCFGLGYALAQQRQSPPAPAGQASARPTAAYVNGEAVSVAELQVELQKRFGADVLRDLVHQRLILQEVKKQKLKQDPAILEKRLEEMKKQPEVEAMLKSGQVEESDLRRNLSTLLPLDALVQSKLTVEEENDFLKRHHGELESLTVQHILLLDQNEAAKVYAEASQPKADFAVLAKKYSLDSHTKNQGGNLGELHRGELQPDIAAALFGLKPGEISPPLPAEDGIHIFRVVSSKTGLDELRPQIREQLIAARRGDYLEELRSSAKIETVPPYRLPASLGSGESGEH